jgi:DNA-directed RNA polymerase specialized sigma subunit
MSEQNARVLRNKKLAYFLGYHHAKRINYKINQDDIVSEALYALVMASRAFNPSKMSKSAKEGEVEKYWESKYIRMYINSHLKTYIRKNLVNGVFRYPRSKDFNPYTFILSFDGIVNSQKETNVKYKYPKVMTKNISVFSSNDKTNKCEEEIYIQQIIKLAGCTKTERKVFTLFCMNGDIERGNDAVISKMLGVSRQSVSEIRLSATKKIRTFLENPNEQKQSSTSKCSR